LYIINDKAGNLWGQYIKIIREKNKYQPNAKPDPVFPEILINYPEVLHKK
jgi:hypothetical protein